MNEDNANYLKVTNDKELIETISDFNLPMTNFFESIGLPTENVLYPIKDRMIVFQQLENAIDELDFDKRKKSDYLTKFSASISVGLFDGAVTYLWNETIKSIRSMIIDFDLVYFFSIAKEINSRYTNLSSPEDLEIIGEYDLLHISNRIGLIDNHVLEVFKHINYMRNHSSSAHPNDNEISSFNIISWLNDCIKYAINAKPNQIAMDIKQLLYNIRNTVIDENDFDAIGTKIQNYPQDTIDDVLQTLFGQYIDPKVNTSTKRNIELLIPYIWNASSDVRKYQIGEKYGYFRNVGATDKKDSAMNFLRLVNGIGYRDEDSIAFEIRTALSNLKSTHFSPNNFYNEAPVARELISLVPENGIIPGSVHTEWVKVIVLCYCGNGLGYYEGVDMQAEPLYRDIIDSFNQKDIYALMSVMDDSELLYDLNLPKPKARFLNLVDIFKHKVSNKVLLSLLNFISTSGTPIDKLHKTTNFKDTFNKINI